MESEKPAVAKFEALGPSDVNCGHISCNYYFIELN
jgi:hypothetical protein